MFGLCVLSRFFGYTFLGIILALPVWAQAQKATIVSSEALVYSEAHFNAEIVATLKRGGIFYVSLKPTGPFYRIRIQKGKMGWIPKDDLQMGELDQSEIAKNSKKEREGDTKKRPFFALKHLALGVDYINYTESTIRGEQSAWTPFLGLKWSGLDTVISGPIFFESNLLIGGAPSYYGDFSHTSASGFIVIADIVLQMVVPRSDKFMTYYGLGSMSRYSNLDLSVSGRTYDAQELTLGVLANYGVAFRLGADWALRLDGKYYWERERYYGFGLSLGKVF